MRKQESTRRKLTRSEKIVVFILCGISISSIIFTLNMRKYDIVKQVYRDYEPEVLNLTTQQKIEDFEYFYDVMMSSFPMVDVYEEVLKIDFEEKKEYYKELVQETETDYEFFCVMSAIVNEFPSFHTDLVFPRYEQYEILGCYNMTSTLCNGLVYPNSLYWDKMLEMEYNKEELRGTVYVGYRYINGEYILCDDMEGISAGAKILEVNGMDIHEYVLTNQFSSIGKKYDVINDKIYVQNFYTNNKFGENIILTVEDCNGNTSYVETFCEKEKSAGLYLHMVYGSEQEVASVNNKSVYSYIDEGRNVGYINISSFSTYNAEIIESSIIEMNECNTIIVDLRNNHGGVPMLVQKYIYPHLFITDVSLNTKWYMLDSSSNRRVIKENYLSLSFRHSYHKVKEDENYFYINRKLDYKGSAVKERDIVILIGSGTGSAADGFASVVKKTNATLVGQNTHGEGLADSFICDYLPNSGLVFTYMFGMAANEDGTDNSLFGTAPDVYAYIEWENYKKCFELLEMGEDAYTYENRLKWDNVLLEALLLSDNNAYVN